MSLQSQTASWGEAETEGRGGGGERERKTERERETDRDREAETERERDRDREAEAHIVVHPNGPGEVTGSTPYLQDHRGPGAEVVRGAIAW